MSKKDKLFDSVTWRHIKSGGLYVVVLAEALIERDQTPAVAYRSLKDGRIWIRPRDEFLERFDVHFEAFEDDGA